MSNQKSLPLKLETTQIALARSQIQLQQSEANLHHLQTQFEQIQLELQIALDEVEAMKTSKFWKMRTVWFKLKEAASLLFKAKTSSVQAPELAATLPIEKILPTAAPPNQTVDYKQLFCNSYASALDAFLSSNATLVLPTQESPLVTIILVLFNRAELTFQCLNSLCGQTFGAFEVIIVDNASSDKTSQLLERVEGAKIIYNAQNLNFLLASNQAAKEASGRYILFLNNDAQVLPGSIASAISTIEASNDIGAVGGKIILLDGTLQEAGSIIWNDGSCLGYGRGDFPFSPEYMFKREVDYCSGAFLLTHRELFAQVGMFDEEYVPAYYEETDYCVKLRRMGKRIIYDPNAVILHFEFASSSSSDRAIELQAAHRQVFLEKHGEYLRTHHLPPSEPLFARSVDQKRRVLFIDDRVPYAHLGSGFPRARDILLALVELGYFVTFYPSEMIGATNDNWMEIYQDIPREVEVINRYGSEKLQQFLQQRVGYYDIAIVSRPHNMKLLKSILANAPELLEKTKLIYDAEAIFALREIAQRRLNGETISNNEMEELIDREMDLATDADAVVSVSALECENFTRYGIQQAYTLGHTLTPSPTHKCFEDRSGILFVGAIHDEFSPNADSVIWFVKHVLPLIHHRLGTQVPFFIIGPNQSATIASFADEHIRVLGKVDDLSDYYEASRIFVAPTRFAAGIPRKMHDAASHGLPIVATSLLATQLDWQDGVDLLVADTPEAFADQCVRLYTEPGCWKTVRANALDRVQQDCSRETFIAKLQKILELT